MKIWRTLEHNQVAFESELSQKVKYASASVTWHLTSLTVGTFIWSIEQPTSQLINILQLILEYLQECI